jgi:hypothetical protein
MPIRPKTESIPMTFFLFFFRLWIARVHYWDLQQTPL